MGKKRKKAADEESSGGSEVLGAAAASIEVRNQKIRATSSRSGLARKRMPCTSGCSWTDKELDFFNIQVVREPSFEAFFKQEPKEEFNQEVMEFLDLNLKDVSPKALDVVSVLVQHVAKDVIAVTKAHRNEDSAVDVSRSLLQLFRYDSGERSIRTRCRLHLEMSNATTEATPDICVEDEVKFIKLLVQEDKTWESGKWRRNLKDPHPEAMLIAEAIAAYQENVEQCERMGIPPYPKQKIIPGIVMLGTRPAFYLIHMTKALADCVRVGKAPEFMTTVQEYYPPCLPVVVPDTMLERRLRCHVAQCLEALKLYL